VRKADEEQIAILKEAIAQSGQAILQGQQAIRQMKSVIRGLEEADTIMDLPFPYENESQQKTA
jgi:hypothetical protein